MMVWLISNLLGTRLGRLIATVVLVMMIVAVALLSVYVLGKRSERLNAELRKLDSIRDRMKIDDEVNSMSAADRRATLRRWVRESR